MWVPYSFEGTVRDLIAAYGSWDYTIRPYANMAYI